MTTTSRPVHSRRPEQFLAEVIPFLADRLAKGQSLFQIPLIRPLWLSSAAVKEVAMRAHFE